MAVEHQPHPKQGLEHAKTELDQAAQERLAELAKRSAEKSSEVPDERAEVAREIIKQHEVNDQQPEPEETEQPEPRQLHRLPHLDADINYRDTMASIQRKLTPTSRAFSQLIHTPAIEKTSEVLEKTIFRPSVALGATWTALIVGLIFYLTARHYGFPLSGSEMLLALIIGGIFGALLEGFGRLFRKR